MHVPGGAAAFDERRNTSQVFPVAPGAAAAFLAEQRDYGDEAEGRCSACGHTADEHGGPLDPRCYGSRAIEHGSVSCGCNAYQP